MNEATTAVMVVVEDGKVREIRVEPLEQVLSVLAALAIQNGQISLEDGNRPIKDSRWSPNRRARVPGKRPIGDAHAAHRFRVDPEALQRIGLRRKGEGNGSK